MFPIRIVENMKFISLFFVLLTSVSISTNAQNFGTWSGTIRIGGGNYGPVYSYITPVTVVLLRTLKFTGFSDKDFQNWSSRQHGAFRFFNIGGDILLPNWTMTASNEEIELSKWDDDNFLNDYARQYTYYIGYYFNWKSTFSRIGLFIGADYEWKNFILHFTKPPYPNVARNKIHSLVPTVGLRYRLLSPLKEIEGFPFNVVLEGGMSFVVNVKYDNTDGYGLEALNNGFRPMLGIAITTNRYGSIHIRWTKDLYNLFNNDYSATEGSLFNNKIYNDFSCYSIGWTIFI